MKSKFKLNNREIENLLDIKSIDFPKYSTQIINLASQNAQATRPAVVGQMSDLIQQFSGKTIEGWEKWYIDENPDAIQNATEKIVHMIDNFRSVIDKIDRQLIENWVRDLVIIKTFIGLRFHEAVLKKTSELLKSSYRLSVATEESKGIDGYIGRIPISIKPETYKSKKALQETIDAKFIYYTKVRGGVTVDISELI